MYTPAPDSVSFTQRIKSHLKHTITSSKRRGAWFSLDRREKSIVYLSVRLDVKFESLQLLRALASIMKKLGQQGETMHAWLIRGTKMAWAISEFAVASGNKGAKVWRNDRDFALFLGRSFSASGAFRT